MLNTFIRPHTWSNHPTFVFIMQSCNNALKWPKADKRRSLTVVMTYTLLLGPTHCYILEKVYKLWFSPPNNLDIHLWVWLKVNTEGSCCCAPSSLRRVIYLLCLDAHAGFCMRVWGCGFYMSVCISREVAANVKWCLVSAIVGKT